jgi:mannosyl-3-phosphoglycerate phosphatase family protein
MATTALGAPAAAGVWLVVSDVDHTLLECPEEASSAGACLRGLQRRGITTLLASSKTFAELVEFQTRAGLPPQPFLFENGCGIGWPQPSGPFPAAAEPAGIGRPGADRPAAGSWPTGCLPPPQLELGGYGAIVRGEGPEALRSLLAELRQELGLGFALLEELPLADIQGLLGLPEHLARLALQRLASLPLLWHDDGAALERLRHRLAPHGLGAVEGGQLVHVGPRFDKGEALKLLLPWLGATPAPLRLLACGDSENDRALLEAADLALVFHPPDRPPLRLTPPAAGQARIERTALAGGPAAWLAAVEAALAEAAAVAAPAPALGSGAQRS